MTPRDRLFTIRFVRSFVPLALFGLAGFGIGRWCIPPLSPPVPAAVKMPALLPAATVAETTPTPAIDRSKSAYHRLSGEFNSRDLWGSAARLMRLIDDLNAEDFRQLAATGFVPSPTSLESDPDFQEAFNDALVQRWLEVDPEGGASALMQFDERMKKLSYHGNGAIPAALARVRPELVLAMVLAGDSSTHANHFSGKAFEALAQRDLSAARRFAEKLSRPDQRKSAEVAIARGIAAGDPVAAIAYAHELRSGEVFREAMNSAARLGPGLLQQVIEAGGGKFSPNQDTIRLMIRYPALSWDQLAPKYEQTSSGGVVFNGVELDLRHAARRLTREECEQALTQLDRSPTPATSKARGAILAVWVEKDSAKAMAWAFERSNRGDDSNETSRFLETSMKNWLWRDQLTAAAWLERQGASPMRDRLGNAAAAAYAEIGKIDSALNLFQPVIGKTTGSQVASLAAAQAKRDPAAAAEWLADLPGQIDRTKAAGDIAAIWLDRDPLTAAQWIESLPAGGAREGAMKGFAAAAAKNDPVVATEWAAAISNSDLRAQAAGSIAGSIGQIDRAAAQAWVKKFPGLEERHRAALLRRFQ